jgi:hypothetical protein
MLQAITSALRRFFSPYTMADYPYQDRVTVLCRRCDYRRETTVQSMAFRWGKDRPCPEIERELRAECPRGVECRRYLAELEWRNADSAT